MEIARHFDLLQFLLPNTHSAVFVCKNLGGSGWGFEQFEDGIAGRRHKFRPGEMTHLLRVGQGLKGYQQLDLAGINWQTTLHTGRGHVVTPKAFFGTGGAGSGKSQAQSGKGCGKCKGKGGVECQGCKGTGRNKKNGNMFERCETFLVLDCAA